MAITNGKLYVPSLSSSKSEKMLLATLVFATENVVTCMS